MVGFARRRPDPRALPSCGQGEAPTTDRTSTAMTLATARPRTQRKTTRSIKGSESAGRRLPVAVTARFALAVLEVISALARFMQKYIGL